MQPFWSTLLFKTGSSSQRDHFVLLQVWLALHNLIVDPRCRAKYDLGDYRKDAILRLKRHMNEILFDQLPILKDLQRVLDEISLGMGAEDAEAQRSRLILEQVGAVLDQSGPCLSM